MGNHLTALGRVSRGGKQAHFHNGNLHIECRVNILSEMYAVAGVIDESIRARSGYSRSGDVVGASTGGNEVVRLQLVGGKNSSCEKSSAVIGAMDGEERYCRAGRREC